ncbi:MAG: DEAD/DEAH box helicase [Verrucomicrobiae bacterium]|nr:DEAD/DEAH box helicase [Verrucomicrobiae bacterium]
MSETDHHRLVTALQNYRPGRILQMGALNHVKNGLSLYESSAVEWDGWRGDSMAKFKVGKISLNIALDGKGNVVCSCKVCGPNRCGHSVAVMATVCHALRGKMGLSSFKFPPDMFEYIRDALFEGPLKPDAAAEGKKTEPRKAAASALPPVRIVQDGNRELDALLLIPRASLSLRGIGSFSSPAAIKQIPPDLRELFVVPVENPIEVEEVLFEFLIKNLGKIPVVIDKLDGDDKSTVLEGVLPDPLAGLLLLRRHADTCSVDVVFAVAPLERGSAGKFSVSKGEPLTNFYRLGKTLIYLPEKRAIARVLAIEMWETQSHGDVDTYVSDKIFQRYHKAKERLPFKLSKPITKTIDQFNLEPFVYGSEGTAEGVLLRYYEGDSQVPVTPVSLPTTVKLIASVDAKSGTAKLCGVVGENGNASSRFDDACEHLDYLDDATGASYARQTAIFTEYRTTVGSFLLCKNPDERSDILDAFLELVDSAQRGARSRYRYEAVFEKLELLAEADAEGIVAATLPGGKQEDAPPWVHLNPVAPILSALAACYKHLPGFRCTIVDEPVAGRSMTKLEVPPADWKRGLGTFSNECKQAGVELTVNGKTVETVSLDFQVVAEPVAPTKPTGDHVQGAEIGGDRIDWFALHPKILCDQVDVPQEQWGMIAQGGAFQTEGMDGVIRVVDTESLERFALFLRAGAGAAGGGKKATQEAAVTVPRLQILDWMQLKKNGIEIILPPEDAAIIDSLLSGTPGNPADMPPTIQATLRPYQIAGYRWMAFLYEHRFGAVLADDMGLGKTLQTITLLAGLDAGLVGHRVKDKVPHLAVLPPSLVFNWRSEIERFLPGLTVYEYTGSKRSLEELRKADVVLTTYELARRDIEKLEQESFDVIIFDEAQAVKNIAAARAKAIRRLNGRFRLCLTGTPLENHVGEYFAILDLALPGLFGEGEDSRKALRASDTGNERYLRRAQPFVLRRTKENVLKDLPPKVESDIYLDLDRTQKEFYLRTVAEVRAEVAQAFAHKPRQQAGIVALSALMRLRQICVAPGVIDPSIKSGSAPKLDHLVEQLKELAQEGHAALVFSQFTRVLDLIEPTLKAAGIAFVRLDGQTPQKTRKKIVDQFQAEDGPAVFLISLKAGGSGLNLTRASYVFHLDPWWNPAVERQASDRAHRIGQTNTVFINRILMRDTIEEKMMILKARKQELYDEIMGSAEAEGERIQSRKAPMITQEDIGFLLGE